MSTEAPYSKEHLDWLRENYPLMAASDLTAAFNEKFGAIKRTLFRKGLRSGRTGRFGKGDNAWNKGKSGYMGENATSFKKGNLPHNHRPLWSERIDRNGYIEMSVPERNPYTGFETRFKHKHVWIWEQTHGKKPKSTAVIFKDGNNRNFELENLILVSRNELLSANLHGYKNQPEELKPVILNIAKIEAKAGFRLCTGRGRQWRKETKC